MDKITLPLIVLVLSLSFSSAIKISPTQSNIDMNQYESSCMDIWVLPEDDYSISSKWSFDGRGDLEKYNLSAEKMKLSINYSHISNGRYRLCFTPYKSGKISGIIYFYSEKNMVEIGSWIDLNVQQVGAIERISLITGNTIKENKEIGENMFLIIIFLLLLITLVLIIKRTLPRAAVKDKHSQIDNSTHNGRNYSSENGRIVPIWQ